MSNSRQTYRATIIGCGPRGTAAADPCHAHPRTTVVGVCDLAPKPLRALGDSLGLPASFSDYESMMGAFESAGGSAGAQVGMAGPR